MSPTKIFLATIGVVVGLIAASLGVWAFNVATSDIKGAGQATLQKNSANNRIAAQQRFEDLYQEVLTADQRIDVAADSAAANPGSLVAQTNLAGAVTYCIDVRGDYNAEARKYTAAEFRAADLPAQIDTYAPSTDCKESTAR